MKKRLLLIYCITYAALLIAVTIYWAVNFSKYSRYKGDEFFTISEVAFIYSYIFFIIIQLTLKKIKLGLLMFLPVIIYMLTFVLGFVFMSLSGMDGIPKQYISIFGIFYCLLSILAAYMFWGRKINEL